ncbi:sensor histidine kinase [Rubellimicrobium arenae]|uniref:sensor histidine kinase n=1 Tax=Rubellimicrobium arenae TaxID=2817372 RepID=UPI001B30758D|nr:PAS domain-containing protein [Rubellimicrobium arenae]
MTARLHLTDVVSPGEGIERSSRAVLDALPSIAFVTDAEGGTVFANSRYQDYTGLPMEALLGHGWAPLVHPEDRARTESAWLLALRDGGGVEVEYRLRGADGRFRWFQGRVAPQRDRSGGIQFWVGTCTDIHDLKTAEAAAREAEAFLRLAQEASGAGTFAWIPETHELHWSAELKAMFGLSADAEMTESLFEARIHPDDRAATNEAVARAFDPAGDGLYRNEYRALWPDGTVRWVDARGRVIFDEVDGLRRGVRFIGTVLDVTEARRTREALAQALESKEALLYEVNHRVKNNLQMVTSLLAMQANRSQNPEVRRHLSEARARIGVMSSIHQSLYTSGAHGDVDVTGFLKGLAEDTVASQGSGRVVLDFTDAGSAMLPLVQALPLALIVSELMTNAMKYAFAGGRGGMIRVAVGTVEGQLQVEVTDDGIGLPEAFDMRQSTGVGMRIISSLATQLRGTLEVGAARGAGASFTIRVPLDGVDPAAPAA